MTSLQSNLGRDVTSKTKADLRRQALHEVAKLHEKISHVMKRTNQVGFFFSVNVMHFLPPDVWSV